MTAWLWSGVRDPVTDERGAALVITLFIVALVTILVLEYHFDATVEEELADNYASEMQAYYLALAGLNFARAVLQKDTNGYDAADEPWAMLAGFGCVSPQQLLALAREVGEAQETGEVPIFESEAARAVEATAATAEAPTSCVRLSIVDEARKLPINALVEPDGCTINETWGRIFERFFEDFKMTEDDPKDAVNALIDWIDTSCQNPDGALPGGAEDDYYKSLKIPYTTQDRPMQVPGELRLVRHFTCETLAKLFPGKECKDVADLDLGSNGFLTPYGGGPGEARVNINTTSEAVLRALTPDDTCVEDILNRHGIGFESQVLKVEPVLNPNEICNGTLEENVVDVRSTYFRIESQGEIGGLVKKKIIAVLTRQGQSTQPGSGPPLVYFKVE